MARNLVLYQLTKRKNSTKRPSGSGASYTIQLGKIEPSIVNPVFRIHASVSDILNKNYMILESTFYYFINNITVLRDGVCEIEGELDVLATYRSSIETSTQYVTRCSDSAKFDEDLYDNVISPSSKVVTTLMSRNTVDEEHPALFSLGETTRVFGFNGSGDIRASAEVTNFYFSTSRSVQSILGDVFCTSNDIFQTIVQSFQQISHNITMVKVFPFKKKGAMGSVPVYVGEWSIQCSGLRTIAVGNFSSAEGEHGRRWTGSITTSIPTGHYGDYRDYDANWVDASVEVPMIGNIALPTWALRYSTLKAEYCVDLISGMGECTLSVLKDQMNDKTIGVYNFVAGYDVPVSAYTENMGQIMGNIMSFNPTGVIGDILAPPTSFTTISNGSGMSNVNLTYMTIQVKVQDTEHFTYGLVKGKKTMKNLQISTLANGTYIECLKPSIDAPAFGNSLDTINAFMEGGFYYEYEQ